MEYSSNCKNLNPIACLNFALFCDKIDFIKKNYNSHEKINEMQVKVNEFLIEK